MMEASCQVGVATHQTVEHWGRLFVPGETEQRAPADQLSYSVSVGRASSVGLWAVSDAICITNGPETGCHPQPGCSKRRIEKAAPWHPQQEPPPLLGDSPPSLTEFLGPQRAPSDTDQSRGRGIIPPDWAHAVRGTGWHIRYQDQVGLRSRNCTPPNPS